MSTDANFNFFYSTICHTCKKRTDNLKRCSICKTIAYCSKNHQKDDWKIHKPLCRVIVKTNNTVTYKVGCSLREWTFYRLALQAAWLYELKRNLHPYESNMWMFARSCAFCYTKDVTKDCSNCLSISYCDNHEDEVVLEHRNHCDKLKLILNIYQYLWNQNKFPLLSIDIIDDSYIALPNSIDILVKKVLKGYESNNVEFVLKTDILAPGAIILYGMEKSCIIQKRFVRKTKLIIHLVGSSSYECSLDWYIISELLLHWIKDLNHILWVLIGPETNCTSGSTNINLCYNCRNSNKTVTVFYVKELYHNIFKEVEKPDLIVAFNCGFHEFQNNHTTIDTWKESIPLLLNYINVPLIITSYTQHEIELDLIRLRNSVCRLETIIEGQKNNFASKRPIRDCSLEEHDLPYFYTNGYVAVVRKHT